MTALLWPAYRSASWRNLLGSALRSFATTFPQNFHNLVTFADAVFHRFTFFPQPCNDVFNTLVGVFVTSQINVPNHLPGDTRVPDKRPPFRFCVALSIEVKNDYANLGPCKIEDLGDQVLFLAVRKHLGNLKVDCVELRVDCLLNFG